MTKEEIEALPEDVKEAMRRRREEFIAAIRRKSTGWFDGRDALIIGKPVRPGEVRATVMGPGPHGKKRGP